MRPLSLFFFVVLVTCLSSWGQTPDPGSVYADGYQIMREGEAFEKRKDFKAAYQKFREADQIFASVARNHPGWNPEFVTYRRKKIREAVRRTAQNAQIDPGRQNPRADPNPNLNRRQGPGVARPPGNGNLNNPVQDRYRFLKKRITDLESERENLIDNLTNKESKLRTAREDLRQARESEMALRDSLEKAQADLAGRPKAEEVVTLKQQVETLKTSLAQANEQLKAANQRTEDVLKELEQANQTIADLKSRQEAFVLQREKMAALIQGLDANQGVKDLVTENMELREKLSAAQSKADFLAQDKEASDQEVLALRQEVSLVRSELANLRQEKEEYEKQIEGLREQLNNTLEMEALKKREDMTPQEIAESVFLRRIITRQLKVQTRRQMARDLVMQELEEMENVSDELVEKIRAMGENVELSEQEKALLAQAQEGEFPELPGTVGDETIREKIVRYAKSGHFDFGQGKYEAAEVSYRKILEYTPHHIPTLCNLGLIRFRMRQYDEAIDHYNKTLVYDPDHAFSHFMMGVIHFYRGLNTKALDHLGEAVRLDSDHAEFQHYYGIVADQMGRSQEALEALEAAVTLRPDYADAQYNLAVFHLNKATPDVDAAREHYRSALVHGAKPDPAMEANLGIVGSG